jgi:Mrp family chromosome partitioning ATPase
MKRNARLGTGLLAFGTVFAAFAGYAYLAPASYRSSALLVCDGCAAAGKSQQYDDVSLALGLERALLEPETLRKLTGELGDDAADLSPLAGARRVRSSLEVESLNGRSFVVSYTDSSPYRAQRLADLLSRRALEQLPGLFGASPSEARARAAEELSVFMARHPELLVAPPPISSEREGAKPEGRDRSLSLLKAERKRLTTRLSEAVKIERARAESSDNPYPDSSSELDDPERIRRRLAEIEAALASPRLSLATSASSAPALSAADRTELGRLIENLTRGPTSAPSDTVRARVVTPAERPGAPISPPRRLLLGFGALFAIAAGLGAALLPLRRRRKPTTTARIVAATEPQPRAVPRRPRATSVLLQRVPPGSDVPTSSRRSVTPEVILPAIRAARIVDVAEARAESSRRKQEPESSRRDPRPESSRRDPRPESSRRDPRPESSRRGPEVRRTLMMGSVENLSTRDTVPLEIVAEPASPRFRQDPADNGRDIVAYSELVAQGEQITPYDVPVGWHPNSALQVERLRGMAHALYPLASEHSFVLAVTSGADAAADKSRTAAELALALAEFAHRRVLLLEGNFTRPSIQRWMRLRVPNAYGFTRQLQAYAERRLYGGWKVIRCTQWLDVCAEGAVRTPGAILGDDFVSALRELQRHYGFIVIDGPSLDEASDCRALDRSLEGVVVVRKHGATLSEERLSSLFTQKRFATVIDSAA